MKIENKILVPPLRFDILTKLMMISKKIVYEKIIFLKLLFSIFEFSKVCSGLYQVSLRRSNRLKYPEHCKLQTLIIDSTGEAYNISNLCKLEFNTATRSCHFPPLLRKKSAGETLFTSAP